GEVRLVRDQHDVARDREAAAEPHRGAVHRRDHGQREADHVEEDGARLLHRVFAELLVALELRHELEVATGAERLAGAGEDHDARVRVLEQLTPDEREPAMQGGVRGVQVLGPAQRHDAHGPVGMDPELVGQRAHRATPAVRTRNSTTAKLNTSFWSPATMWRASGTSTYSACGITFWKAATPSALTISLLPPRTSRVGAVIVRAGSATARGFIVPLP